MRNIFTTLVICLFASFINAQTTYNFTGSAQYYVVPACVDSVIVDVIGAEGGTGSIGSNSNTASPGGKGGRVEAKIPVTPGDTLYVYVGGKGEDDDNTTAALGGWNGGGEGAIETQYTYYGGGGGGGASDIRLNDTTLNDRIVVAGGGGGAGADGCTANDLYGGDGGGLIGAPGESGTLCSCDPSGQGGTQSAGGAKGDWGCSCNAQDGTLGQGGMSNTTSCGGPAGAGGGGGGYYGGGGGGLGGGGGGSSYTTPNATDVVHTQGFQTGDGLVIITPIGGLVLSATVSPSDTVCEGDMVTLTGSGADTYTWNNGVSNGVPFTADSSLTYKMVGNDTTAGCSDSITVDLFVMPAPDASFSHTNTGLNYNFTNTEAGGVNWEWDFGDGDTSNLQNPNHAFSEEGQFIVCLTVTDTNGCSSSSCDTIDATYPLGVSEQISNDELTLYPNPAKDILNIKVNANDDISGIEVYSMKGKLVLSKKGINRNIYSLRTDELASGRYMLKIIATDQVVTKKFTINN